MTIRASRFACRSLMLAAVAIVASGCKCRLLLRISRTIQASLPIQKNTGAQNGLAMAQGRYTSDQERARSKCFFGGRHHAGKIEQKAIPEGLALNFPVGTWRCGRRRTVPDAKGEVLKKTNTSNCPSPIQNRAIWPGSHASAGKLKLTERTKQRSSKAKTSNQATRSFRLATPTLFVALSQILKGRQSHQRSAWIVPASSMTRSKGTRCLSKARTTPAQGTGETSRARKPLR